MANYTIDNTLDNLNGFSKEELIDVLERFINQIVKTLEAKHCTIDKPLREKRKVTNGYIKQINL